MSYLFMSCLFPFGIFAFIGQWVRQDGGMSMRCNKGPSLELNQGHCSYVAFTVKGYQGTLEIEFYLALKAPL